MSAVDDTAAAGRLTRTTGTGPLRGLAGLTGAELRRWFPSRAIALAVVGSAVPVIVFAIWSSGTNAANPRLGLYVYNAFGIWSALLLLAMVATAQGAMADEIEAGTAEWVAAKPVGRPAFVLSKFLAAVVGVVLGAIAVPGIVLRVLVVQAEGHGDTEFSAEDVFGLLAPDSTERSAFMTLPPIGHHLAALVLLSSILVFIVALMILAGCVIRSRAAVFLIGLAIPIGLLVYSIIGPSASVQLTPAWAFDSLLATIQNEAAPILAPTVITAAWTAGIVAGAMAWFSRMEL
jgi:hypothetical protein